MGGVRAGVGSFVSGAGVASAEPKDDTIKLQNAIMAIVHSLKFENLKSVVTAKDRVRLAACSQAGADTWQTVHPLEEALRLSDGEYVSASRHQYGLSPITRDWYCRCGDLVSAGHYHACNRVHGPATNTRHETVVSELATFGVSHLQLHVEKAPSIATTDGKLIDGASHIVPDVIFRGAGVNLAIDVSFVYSESDGRVDKASAAADPYKVVSTAMAERANVKIRKYREACKRDGIAFDAFVADSHGVLHASAGRVIDALVKYGANELGVESSELKAYIRRRVAIAIQRGNARLDQHAMALSRNGYGRAVALGYVQPRAGKIGGAADQ